MVEVDSKSSHKADHPMYKPSPKYMLKKAVMI